MSKVIGTVEKVLDKSGRGKSGKPYVLFNFKLEDGEWYGLEFGTVPKFQEGDAVEFEADKNDRGYLTVMSEVKILPRPQKAATSTSTASPVSGGTERQQQIVWQHSQEIAVRVVTVLLANNALPMSKAATKAGEAKRFEEIVAFVDKLTVKYAADVATGRVLDVVADMGVIDTAPDAAVPGPGESTDTSGDKY